jgi:hypothetical protein
MYTCFALARNFGAFAFGQDNGEVHIFDAKNKSLLEVNPKPRTEQFDKTKIQVIQFHYNFYKESLCMFVSTEKAIYFMDF